ncbi:hypothetical protein B4U79_01727 [Dinothrombium tinctorium]|uniref:BZIP domain-containing protein n=1 Tax=Dinothrombium tinctorium TaxID=1965070 RepID=A0A3S3P3K9_9ACAR|nr:hypothetical protein B4U79_12128 [Dinothrombium tinctorium]RWS14094.1 hypothetical protein B4U79_06719 [Dinothrombium tinctorium]RWS14813.1 hypothetical protein B4U79_00913 [Dinothrombium tinctorium]RWS14857.1 hypothetical protein B4U79_01727 [Dinothrombium tinctorium]
MSSQNHPQREFASSPACDTRSVQQQQYNVHQLNAANSDYNSWSNSVASNTDFSVSLTAIKHDHPLLASGYDFVAKNGNGYVSSDGMLIGSLPPSASAPLTNATNWQLNEMEKKTVPYCMPYGYCYDQSFLQQTQPKLNDISDIMVPIPLEDEWILNNKMFSCDTDLNPQMWSPTDYYEKPIKVEDAFQIDKEDLKSSPTLAELNSTSDVWESIDLDELLASSDPNSRNAMKNNENNNLNCHKNVSVPTTQPLISVEEDPKIQEHIDYLSSMLVTSAKENTANPPITTNTNDSSSNKEPMTTTTTTNSSQISDNYQQKLAPKTYPMVVNPPKPAPTVLSTLLNAPSVEKPAIKVEPMQVESISEAPMTSALQQRVSESSPSQRIRNNSMSTECSFSSHDDGFESESDASSDDESFYGDYDANDLLGASTSDDVSNKWALNMGRSRKGGQQRYFWQYNVQSKGPKGTRISSIDDNNGDPHVLAEASDPVFSADCHVEGVKHAGKARRGDGNDLTPNPKKLLMIGLELKKLSKIINDLTPVAEVPVTARNRSRKEKNKLASRACRLKKKAQHEANKIKLFGLQQEHKRLMSCLIDIRKVLRRAVEKKCNQSGLTAAFDQIVAQKGPSILVAGKTTEFVNSILDNVAAGINNGGLDKV